MSTSLTMTLARDIEAIEVDDLKIALMINLFIEALSEQKVLPMALVILRLIICMTDRNFAMEKRVMARYQYIGREEHIKAHETLTSYISGLETMLNLDNDFDDIDAPSVIQFLTRWHAEHAVYSDGHLIDFLNAIAPDNDMVVI